MVILLVSSSCSYNDIELHAGVDIPNPFFPISAGVDIKLKDNLPLLTQQEKEKHEEDIYNKLIGESVINDWMRNDTDSKPSSRPSEGNDSDSGSESRPSR